MARFLLQVELRTKPKHVGINSQMTQMKATLYEMMPIMKNYHNISLGFIWQVFVPIIKIRAVCLPQVVPFGIAVQLRKWQIRISRVSLF